MKEGGRWWEAENKNNVDRYKGGANMERKSVQRMCLETVEQADNKQRQSVGAYPGMW